MLDMSRLLALVWALVGWAAVASAADTTIWVEAESGAKKQIVDNPGLNTINPYELSGGQWVCSFAHDPQPAGTVECAAEVPQAGKYHLWARGIAGTGLSYTLDGGPAPVEVDTKKGVDPISIAANGDPHYPPQAYWFDLGELDLTAGKHALTWSLGGAKDKNPWGGLDCFVLTTGAFTPNGKYKPGDQAPTARAAFEPGRAWDFVPPDDTFDAASQLDLRGLNEKEAGEHGFVKASPDGNNFVRGDGQPIRFWAVLLGPEPNKNLEQQKQAAHFLAKRGVNIARLFSGVAVTKEGAKITDVDEKFIDEMFKTVAALKSAGIYTMTSPYWATSVNVPKSWGIPGVSGEHSADGLLFFDPTMQEGYKAWVKAMYTRKNPYTGLTLAEDPAVAILQIQNEDSLIWWGISGIKGEQLAHLRQMYGDFLKKKYGSLDKARETWKDYKSEYPADEWDKGLPGFLHIWDLSRDGWEKKGKIPGFAERSSSQTEFLAKVMSDFNRDMAKYFREELGCKQLVNAGNWRTNDPLLSQDAEYWSYTANDIVARNIYTGGSHAGVQAGWNIKPGDVYTDVSMTLEPVKLPTNLKRPVGRAFIIPETSWTPPDLYQSEGPLMIASQMCLSGANGAFWSCTGMDFWTKNMTYKWAWNTPMLLGQFPAAALIYRQGLVKEGEPAVVEHRTLQDLWDRKTPIISEESGWDPNRDTDNITMKSAVKTAADPLAYLVGPVRVVYDSDPAKTTVQDLAKFIDREKKVVKSDTGQIESDYGKGVYRVNAPMVQAAAGFLKAAGPQQLADVAIDCRNPYAAIVVLALDGQSIKESAKVLIQVGTTCRPAGWTIFPTRILGADKKETDAWRIISTGVSAGPWQVENTEATVTVANGGLTKATLLDVNGMAQATVVEAKQADGKLTVGLPANALYVVLTGGK